MIPMLVLFCSTAILADTPDAGAEKEVLAALNAWRQAMIARDRESLDLLYAPGLIYTHSNGKQENKAEAIEAVVHGKDRIESIDLEKGSVSTYGTTAIVKARISLRVNNGGTPTTLNLDVLHVWIKLSSRWQMVARQATRLNPS